MRPIEQDCVRLWQEAQAKMWRGRCVWCKRELPGAGHHIIRRGLYLTKFELLNGVYLCSLECHPKAHKAPDALLAYLKAYWPDLYAWQEEWLPKANQALEGWNMEDLEDIRDGLRRFVLVNPIEMGVSNG